MSILTPFDMSDWNNGNMDAYVENSICLKKIYGLGACAVLVATENCPFHDIMKGFPFVTKYINLSGLMEGEYDRLMEEMKYWTCDGLMLDNIDKLPDNNDKEYWQEFVRLALKKEAEFPCQTTSGTSCGSISFDRLHVAARCHVYPEYLKDKSLQCVVIGIYGTV